MHLNINMNMILNFYQQYSISIWYNIHKNHDRALLVTLYFNDSQELIVLTLFTLCISKNCIKIEINLNFYFHTYL